MATLWNVWVRGLCPSPFLPSVGASSGSLMAPFWVPWPCLFWSFHWAPGSPRKVQHQQEKQQLPEMQCVQINYSVELSLTLLRPESSLSVSNHRQGRSSGRPWGPVAPGAGGLWPVWPSPSLWARAGIPCVPLACAQTSLRGPFSQTGLWGDEGDAAPSGKGPDPAALFRDRDLGWSGFRSEHPGAQSRRGAQARPPSSDRPGRGI